MALRDGVMGLEVAWELWIQENVAKNEEELMYTAPA